MTTATSGPAEVRTIYLREEVAGRGIGRDLFASANDRLRDLGYRRATLWVMASNERSRRFYERAGWSWDGRTSAHRFDCGNVPIVRYAADLSPSDLCSRRGRTGVDERHDRVLDPHGLVLAHALRQDRELDPVLLVLPDQTQPDSAETSVNVPVFARIRTWPSRPSSVPWPPVGSANRRSGAHRFVVDAPQQPRPCPDWSRGPRTTARRRRGARIGGRRSPR